VIVEPAGARHPLNQPTAWHADLNQARTRARAARKAASARRAPSRVVARAVWRQK
jgi:hypothetical protein